MRREQAGMAVAAAALATEREEFPLPSFVRKPTAPSGVAEPGAAAPETSKLVKETSSMNHLSKLVLSSTVALSMAACQGPRAAGPDHTEVPVDQPADEEAAVTETGSQSAVGTWGNPAGEWGVPFLKLSEDGKLAGYDGCNRMFGSWTKTEGGAEFGLMGATKMACQDVDTWLERAHTARVEGDALIVLNADGAEIGRLDRQP